MNTKAFSFTVNELKAFLTDNSIQHFKAKILYKWFYDKHVYDYNEMTDLSKSDRELLQLLLPLGKPKPYRVFQSKIDSTKKFLFDTEDGFIESVVIPDADRNTLCLSSQTGCSLKCSFCATGRKPGRNLETAEIIYQFLGSQLNTNRITNIVFMGMGEPLLNIDNVLKAIEILNASEGIKIGARKITVSTAGIVPGIERLIEFPLQIKLAVSLNSAIQNKRELIMPVAKTYPLPLLIETLHEYQRVKNKRITFEYIVIPEFNNGREDISAIYELLKGIDCKVNLIPFNNIADSRFREPTEREMAEFFEAMAGFKDAVSIRKSKGRDISGACGQLSGREKQSD